MINQGDKVKMSEELKLALTNNGSEYHVQEFGNCEGYVEDTIYENANIKEVNVRWSPSNLRYGYNVKDLIKI